MQSQLSVSRKSIWPVRKRNTGDSKPVEYPPDAEDGSSVDHVLSSDFVTVSFDVSDGVLYQTWRGFCPESEFRKAVDDILQFMEERSIRKTVIDVRLQKVVSPTSQVYTEERFLDFISRNGSLYTAFVVIEKSIGDICTRAYDRRMYENHGLRINAFFDSVEGAEAWLREV